MALLPVADALARILDGVHPTQSEAVPVTAADGRVLAVDLVAKLTQPPFDASAMDGYAVRAADVSRLPATLAVIGESAAGKAFDGTVAAGEAVRIFTGAPVPRGADTIVIQENADVARSGQVVVRDGAIGGAHIRTRGGDFETGQRLLDAGRRLDPRALTLAAAMGHGSLFVRRKPVVAILATGNELVAPGAAPGPDQIVSSNPVGLAALVDRAGGEARDLGIALDTQASLSGKIADAGDADILVTIGGASVGDHDLVAPALQDVGMALDFWKIAMRPGKPMLFGRRGSQRVIGLPGNPVSCLVTARVFLVPLIHALLGRPPASEPPVHAQLSHPIDANGPRTHYMRARLARDFAGRRIVTPLPNQDSSFISVLASSNCLIVRDVNAPAADAGDEVNVMELDF